MAGIFLQTDLEGKINNLAHFKQEALLPVFEAIVNSTDAIEDLHNHERGTIIVRILRETTVQEKLVENGEEKRDIKKIKSFEIEDNGIGFNNVNFASFCTSDSTYKLRRGGKGVGRFVWLKAFDHVEIESVYSESDKKRLRRIEFSKNKGILEKSNNEVPDKTQRKTIVRLIDFKEDYRRQPSAYKTSYKIAQRILEYCLSYYIGGIAPSIKVVDEAEVISLDNLFTEIRPNISKEEIEIEHKPFTIAHIKLFKTYDDVHNIVFCADYRDVKTYSIKELLGTSALFDFDDHDSKFYYVAYISSSYLDSHVDNTRTSFNIPEDDSSLANYYGDDIISMGKIKNTVIERTKMFLSRYLDALKAQKYEKVHTFINENPALRAVPTYCPEIFDEIDANSSSERINEILYKSKGKAEYKIQQDTTKLLKTQVDSLKEVQDQYVELTQKIEAFNKDQLTQYLVYRKLIIDLLDKKLQFDEHGRYYNEGIVHDIIFPRKASTNVIGYNNHNLWIIDEQLTFHEFAASDLPLNKISTSESDLRPDVIVFSENSTDRIARAVSIIEFKKPQRKNFDQDPVSQMYESIRKIVDNKVILPNGRTLIVDGTTRFYCYAICDINDEIKKFAENHNFSALKDNLGYYSYNTALKAHTEILAFDQILNDVKKRHKIFFETLGIQQK